jgi:hypothetical protein
MNILQILLPAEVERSERFSLLAIQSKRIPPGIALIRKTIDIGRWLASVPT